LVQVGAEKKAVRKFEVLLAIVDAFRVVVIRKLEAYQLRAYIRVSTQREWV
jgi:hypothetical protein